MVCGPPSCAWAAARRGACFQPVEPDEKEWPRPNCPCLRFKGLPDVHYSDDRHWVSGNLGVSEWLLTGTTPEGSQVRVRGCDHWEFRDGKVIRKDSYWKIVEKPA